MRIGFNGRGLRDPLLRGFNRYTLCLLLELQERADVELHIYTDHRSPVHPYFRDRLRARIVQTRVPRTLLWEQVVLPWQLRRDRIDVFHAPCESGLPAVQVCPYVLTYHGVPNSGIADRIRSGELAGEVSQYVDGADGSARVTAARHRALRRLYLRAADVIVTVSEFSKSELVRLLDVPRDKVEVTREAAAAIFLQQVTDQEAAQLRRRHRLPESFLLFVGGDQRHKNVGALLRVLARLKPHRPELALVLVGVAMSSIRSQAAELGLDAERDVICLERIPDVELRGLYHLATAFVTLSWHEGFCLPVVEAMSCGTPIVASRFGAIPEILESGGLLVDPRDPDRVTASILELLNSSALRNELKRKALRRSEAFSWKQTADETMRIYERLAQTKGPTLQPVPA